VGISVFEHICKEDGVTLSLFINNGANECDNHHDDHANEDNSTSCCHKEKSKDDKDCCSDDMEYFKLKVDLDSHAQQKIVPELIAIEINSRIIVPEFSTLEDHYTSDYVNPPPVESGEQRIKKQVWII
jgi:hypothetical protein